MSVVIKQNKIVFFSLFILSLGIASVGIYILPDRFFYDAKLIAYDPYSEAGFIGSYPLTMMFYKITMLRKLPFNVIGILQLFVYFFILYKIGVPKQFEKTTLKNTIVYLSFLMVAIFIAMPSKEFITFVFIAHVLYIFRHRQINFQLGWLYIMLAFVIFGVFFRPYFALIPLISVALYLISKIKYTNRTLGIFVSSILIISLLSIVYYFLNGEFFSDEGRNNINKIRIDEKDANSMILPLFENDVWWKEIINNFYAFFSVNFPITEVQHFLSPHIMIFILWQVVLISILAVRFSWVFSNRKYYRIELWLFFILVAYLAIQTTFEPDLGSAVRHKIGILPLFYYLLYYDDFKNKI